ncbi:HD-GYP domain-containing protein [Niallia sp. Krafla_26]|uniref:HD-GYP domain-containing protein n=1 Tax=Niallia sp. Krafla_26 TaxID=3064703 RepID=UPI003D16F260
MFNLLNKGLNHPDYFRYGFFSILLFSIILNKLLLHSASPFYIFYIISVIFLGIGYYNKPIWFLLLFTEIVVVARYLCIPDSDSVSMVGSIFIHSFTYLLITFISAGLMKYVQKVKEDQLELTKALANALDSRDPYTSNHSKNVAKNSLEIAQKMNLPKDMCDVIYVGGLLHDIGKIGIPEHVLNKPEKLTDEEFNIIKTHPTIGYNIIKHVTNFNKNGVLDVVLYHHERYDGKGYPKGLKGEQIPLVARIVAVADTFDAMSSKRVYRDELELEYILNEIHKSKGAQFDPKIVDVFLSLVTNK